MQLAALVKCILGAAAALWAVKPVREAQERVHHEHMFPGMPFNPWTSELAQETLLHTLPASSLLVADYLAKRLSAPPTAELDKYSEDAFLSMLSSAWDNAGSATATGSAATEEGQADAQLPSASSGAKKALRKAGKELWRLCGGIEQGQELKPLPVPIMNCIVKGVLLLHAAQPIFDAREQLHHEHKYPGMPFNPWTQALARRTMLHAVPEGAWWAGERLAQHLRGKHRSQLAMPTGQDSVAPPVNDELRHATEVAIATDEELNEYVQEAEATSTKEAAAITATEEPNDHWLWLLCGVPLGALCSWLTMRCSRRETRSKISRVILDMREKALGSASSDTDSSLTSIALHASNKRAGSSSSRANCAYHNIGGEAQHFKVYDQDFDCDSSSTDDQQSSCWPARRRAVGA